MGMPVKRNDADAVLGLGEQYHVVPVLHDLQSERRHQQTRHSVCVAVSCGVAFTMDVIIIGLLEGGRQVG